MKTAFRLLVLCLPLLNVACGEERAQPAQSAWQRRATKAAEAVMDGEGLGEKLRTILHPTGKNGDLTKVCIGNDGPGIVVTMEVRWAGGLVGSLYTTIVTWRLNEKVGHVSATVDRDDALVRASEKRRAYLDEFCRTKLLKAFEEELAKQK
ncbi:MAG: hypothetical protein NTW87_12090 [Planctomycetota bacterium]|nr:hypothetical protein [Planctomycetota bacterium]